LTPDVIKNIARKVDDIVADNRMRKHMDEGVDFTDAYSVLESDDGHAVLNSYFEGLESTRGPKQAQFGFNPLDSNYHNGYKLKVVKASEASKYKQTGEMLSDGRLELVYAPADEFVAGNQSGVMDNGTNPDNLVGNTIYHAERGKDGSIIVDGTSYKLEKGVRPIGRSSGKYTFRMKDQSKLNMDDGIDATYSSMFSRNVFASSSKRMEDMISTRVMGFLKQQGG